MLKKILGTCRTTVPVALYKKVIDNFSYLYTIMLDQGRIPEEVFDELGIPPDRDINGKVVMRNAGISQESQQRSKWLMHKHQIGLRKERIQCIEYDRSRKMEQYEQKIAEEINEVEAVETKLLISLSKDLGHETPTLVECTMSHFASLSSPELADFIWGHDPNVLLKKDIPKNKGSLVDAIAAIDNDSTADNNRIFTAYMCRNLPNILS